MFKITLTTGEKINLIKLTSILYMIDEINNSETICIRGRYIFTKHIVSIIEE